MFSPSQEEEEFVDQVIDTGDCKVRDTALRVTPIAQSSWYTAQGDEVGYAVFQINGDEPGLSSPTATVPARGRVTTLDSSPEEKQNNGCCLPILGTASAAGAAWLGVEMALYLKWGTAATVVLGVVGALTAVAIFLLLVRCMRTPSVGQHSYFSYESPLLRPASEDPAQLQSLPSPSSLL